MELDYKIITTIIGITITIIWYYYYIKNIYKWTNKPHLYSWIIWASALSIGFLIQVHNEWGYWSFITMFEALCCILVAIIAITKWEKYITKSDKICLLTAAIALMFWLVLNQPLISILLIIAVDFFGFIPTIRKSYLKPYEECLSVYIMWVGLFILALIGLTQYTLVTYLYPVSIIFTNLMLIIIILWRRKNILEEKLIV